MLVPPLVTYLDNSLFGIRGGQPLTHVCEDYLLTVGLNDVTLARGSMRSFLIPY
jgi:hypothetical protein